MSFMVVVSTLYTALFVISGCTSPLIEVTLTSENQVTGRQATTIEDLPDASPNGVKKGGISMDSERTQHKSADIRNTGVKQKVTNDASKSMDFNPTGAEK